MNIFFMQLVPDDPLPGFAPLSAAAKERLYVLGALLLVVGALVFWVAVIRKKPRKRKEHHHHRRSFGKTAGKGVTEIKEMIQERKQRRRRRDHRARNPTLAETGGLPPARAEEPPAQPQTPSPP